MISETEKSIPGMPGKHTLKDFNAFENHKSYDCSALEFDLVEPGDLVKIANLYLEPWQDKSSKKLLFPLNRKSKYKMHQAWNKEAAMTGIVLHTDLTNYFVTVLVDCKKLHFYYRSVKKL